MKANAEPHLFSSLVWIDSGVVVSQHRLELECNRMTSFMEFMCGVVSSGWKDRTSEGEKERKRGEEMLRFDVSIYAINTRLINPVAEIKCSMGRHGICCISASPTRRKRQKHKGNLSNAVTSQKCCNLHRNVTWIPWNLSFNYISWKKDSKRCCDTTMPESIHTND